MRLFQYRYGAAPGVYGYTSANGGASLDGGLVVGFPPFEDAVVGPGETLSGITSAYQEGTVFQTCRSPAPIPASWCAPSCRAPTTIRTTARSGCWMPHAARGVQQRLLVRAVPALRRQRLAQRRDELDGGGRHRLCGLSEPRRRARRPVLAVGPGRQLDHRRRFGGTTLGLPRRSWTAARTSTATSPRTRRDVCTPSSAAAISTATTSSTRRPTMGPPGARALAGADRRRDRRAAGGRRGRPRRRRGVVGAIIIGSRAGTKEIRVAAIGPEAPVDAPPAGAARGGATPLPPRPSARPARRPDSPAGQAAGHGGPPRERQRARRGQGRAAAPGRGEPVARVPRHDPSALQAREAGDRRQDRQGDPEMRLPSQAAARRVQGQGGPLARDDRALQRQRRDGGRGAHLRVADQGTPLARAQPLAPPGDGVGERALERDLGLPAGRRAQPARVAADLHHLV